MPRDVANLTLVPPGEDRALSSMGTTSPLAAELLPADDGAADLGSRRADPNLVTEVLHEVGRVHAEATVALYRRIAEIILDRFFAGDLDAMQARARSHVSLKAMMQDPRLQIPASQLWYALALLPQLRALGPLASQLPMSHHRLLIHVHNPEVKRELAEKAVAEGMSKRVLESAVRGWKGGSRAPRTRAPDPSSDTYGSATPAAPVLETHRAGETEPAESTVIEESEALALLATAVRAVAALREPRMREILRQHGVGRAQVAALREAVDGLDDIVDAME